MITSGPSAACIRVAPDSSAASTNAIVNTHIGAASSASFLVCGDRDAQCPIADPLPERARTDELEQSDARPRGLLCVGGDPLAERSDLVRSGQCGCRYASPTTSRRTITVAGSWTTAKNRKP